MALFSSFFDTFNSTSLFFLNIIYSQVDTLGCSVRKWMRGRSEEELIRRMLG